MHLGSTDDSTLAASHEDTAASQEATAQTLLPEGSEPPVSDTLELPEVAELSLVGRISGQDMYLTADGGWRADSKFPTLFAKQRCDGDGGARAEE